MKVNGNLRWVKVKSNTIERNNAVRLFHSTLRLKCFASNEGICFSSFAYAVVIELVLFKWLAMQWLKPNSYCFVVIDWKVNGQLLKKSCILWWALLLPNTVSQHFYTNHHNANDLSLIPLEFVSLWWRKAMPFEILD